MQLKDGQTFMEVLIRSAIQSHLAMAQNGRFRMVTTLASLHQLMPDRVISNSETVQVTARGMEASMACTENATLVTLVIAAECAKSSCVRIKNSTL
jgi:hypothetical protein